MATVAATAARVNHFGTDIWRCIFVMLQPTFVIQRLSRVNRQCALSIRDELLWHMWWSSIAGGTPLPRRMTPVQLRTLVILYAFFHLLSFIIEEQYLLFNRLTTGDGRVRLRSIDYPFLPYIEVCTISLSNHCDRRNGLLLSR
jgi:hypothetical protein